MVEMLPQEVALIIVVPLLLGALIGAVIYHFNYGEGRCKHEWEKVIDDTIVSSGEKLMGHQVVFFCNKCGKYKSKKVNYDKI